MSHIDHKWICLVSWERWGGCTHLSIRTALRHAKKLAKERPGYPVSPHTARDGIDIRVVFKTGRKWKITAAHHGRRTLATSEPSLVAEYDAED